MLREDRQMVLPRAEAEIVTVFGARVHEALDGRGKKWERGF